MHMMGYAVLLMANAVHHSEAPHVKLMVNSEQ